MGGPLSKLCVTPPFSIDFSVLNLFSSLHITSEVQDIPEAYIHLIHTQQYYTLQYIICSTVETTKQRLGDLRHRLKRWGYNDKVIESGFSKVSEINRNDLLEYKEKKDQQMGSPCSLTYHPSLEKISGIVRHHWKKIEKSEMLAKLFPEPPVVAFRRLKSIKDTLVRAVVSRPSSTVGQC